MQQARPSVALLGSEGQIRGHGTRLADLIDEFSRRPDISPHTRTTYRDHLRIFLPWALEQGATEPEQLTPALVDAYARNLEGRTTRKGTPLSAASRRTYLKGVQMFLSWLQQRKQVQEVDPKAVGLPRLRRQHREVLTRAEIQRLEDAAPTERNKLLIRLMADTGAREGGVAGVRIEDLILRDSRYHFVRIRDKTGERLPPVTRELYQRLRSHASGKTGRPKTSSPYLFMATRRRPDGDYEPLTEDGVYQAVKDAVIRAELGKRVYPHLLRHSAITHMVAKGMHPALISDITGVGVSVIAQHYSHPSDQQRYEAMMKVMQELDG